MDASALNFRPRIALELSRQGVVNLTPMVVPSYSMHTAVGYRSGEGTIEFAITRAGETIAFGSTSELAYVDATEAFYVAGLVDAETQNQWVSDSLYPGGKWIPGRFEPILAYLCQHERLEALVTLIGQTPVDVGMARRKALRTWLEQH